MEAAVKSEYIKIEIMEEILETQPKNEPVPIETVQTQQIKFENTDLIDFTACSTFHNLQQISGVSQPNNEDQLMQLHSSAACTSAGNSKKITRTSDKHLTCDICSKKLSHKRNLKRHMLTHTGHKPFTCDVCTNKFSLKETLKTHMLTHTGHKPFTCNICSKKFSLRGHLKIHILTHTGHKPFTCDICSKKFSLRRHLKAHILTHTGHKAFTCDICRKRFSRRGTLKRHMITHERNSLS